MQLLGIRRLAYGHVVAFERLHLVASDDTYVAREVVRHPGAVVVAPHHDGALVMIRQYRVSVGMDLLELPAGKLDVAGELPHVTAIRECEEEIGFRPGDVKLLHEFFTSPGFTDERMYLYEATKLVAVERRPVGIEEEKAEIVKIPMPDAFAAARRGEILDGKTLLGLFALELRYGEGSP